MDRHGLFGYCLETDDAATRDWYAQAGEWDCDCGHCRNFLALARRGALPEPAAPILKAFGIPQQKATHVCELGRAEGGAHLYEFSYRAAGRILSGPERGEAPFFCGHETYPCGAPGFPEPHFDLQFILTLPWVLDPSEND